MTPSANETVGSHSIMTPKCNPDCGLAATSSHMCAASASHLLLIVLGVAHDWRPLLIPTNSDQTSPQKLHGALEISMSLFMNRMQR